IAEFDDELTETYLMDEESVTPDMIRRALRKGTLANKITPVLCGSAFKNKGVQPLLDAVIDYLPSPLDVPPVHGIDPRTEHELSRRPAVDEPFSALAFKVMSDPYVGKLTYIRVYSGQVNAGDRVLNTTKGDQDKLGAGLQRLTEEDPTFRVRTDDETGQTLISGMGELHLEIIVDRLTREFSVDANVGRPQVAYRETVSKPVDKIEGRFVRQTGGRGQYGHAVIKDRKSTRLNSSHQIISYAVFCLKKKIITNR